MTKFTTICFCLIILFINYATAISNLKLLKDADFEYSGRKDPNTWAETFEYCNGTNQSPVALNECEIQIFPKLNFAGHFDIRPERFLMHNQGYTVEILYEGEAPTLTYGPLNGIYKLLKIHFHWGSSEEGSEHQINGIFYGMEAHLVHFKEEYGTFQNAINFPDGVAVVALMFEDSSTNNDDLTHIISNLQFIHEVDAIEYIPEDSMTWLSKYLESPGRSYFTYSGSLTTPPCNEVVTWIVLTNTVHVGRQQIAQFRRIKGSDGEPILENRRPLQALNNRAVSCSL